MLTYKILLATHTTEPVVRRPHDDNNYKYLYCYIIYMEKKLRVQKKKRRRRPQWRMKKNTKKYGNEEINTRNKKKKI